MLPNYIELLKLRAVCGAVKLKRGADANATDD